MPSSSTPVYRTRIFLLTVYVFNASTCSQAFLTPQPTTIRSRDGILFPYSPHNHENTALFAHMSSAESYLATLTDIIDQSTTPPADKFFTQNYLSTLSPTPEEFLTQLSDQLQYRSVNFANIESVGVGLDVGSPDPTSSGSIDIDLSDNGFSSAFTEAANNAFTVISDASMDMDLKSQLSGMSYDFSITNEPDLNPKKSMSIELPKFDFNKFNFGRDGNKLKVADSTPPTSATSASTSTSNTVVDNTLSKSMTEIDSTSSPSVEFNEPSMVDDNNNNNLNAFSEATEKISNEAEKLTKEISESSMNTMNAIQDSVTESVNNNAEKISEEASTLAKELSESTSTYIRSLEQDFSNTMDQVANGGANFAKDLSRATGNAVSSFSDAITNTRANLAKQTNTVGTNVGTSLTKPISDGTTSTVQFVQYADLEVVAKSSLKAIKFMGGLAEQCLNVLLGTFAGTSVQALVQSAQKSIDTMVTDATTSITQTITDIGNITLAQVVQGIVAVVIAISKIIMIIINALVKLASGKDTGEWVLAAKNSVTQQASQLSLTASHTAYDTNQASVNQLSTSMEDFSGHVGSEILNSVATLNDMIGTDVVTTFIP